MHWEGRAAIRVLAAAITLLAGAAGAGAQQAVVRAPEAGSELPWWRPTVVIDVPGASQELRGRLRVLIDGSDITEFAEWQGDSLHVTSPLPLPDGPHVVECRELIAGAPSRVLARVHFVTKPPRRRLAVDARASDGSGLEAGHAVDDTVTLAPHADGTLQTTGSSTAFDATWNQDIPLEGVPSFRAPLVVAEHTRGRLRLSGGLTDADLQADARFIGSRTHRQVAGGSYDAGRAGTLTAYTNLADGLPSSDGTAERPYWIQNLSWQAKPLGGSVVTVLGQYASSRGSDDPAAAQLTPEQGSLVGAHVAVRIRDGWKAVGEAMLSHQVTEGAAGLPSDIAARAEITGTFAGQRLEASASSVGTSYRNPADPGLQSDRRRGAASVSRESPHVGYKAGFAAERDGLDGTVGRSDSRHVTLSVSATPVPSVKLGVDIDRHQVERPSGGRVETRAAVKAGAGSRRARADIQAARSQVEDSQTGISTWTFLRASGRAGPWRGVSVSGGGGFDRRAGLLDARIDNLYLETAFAVPRFASRIAVSGAGDSEERPGRRVTRRWLAVAWSPPVRVIRWQLSMFLEGRWQLTRDDLAGTSQSGGQGVIRVAWNPTWTWSR